MRYSFLYSCFFIGLYSCYFSIYSAQNTDSFVKELSAFNLHKFPIFKLYDNTPIKFTDIQAYQAVVDNWQIKLDRGFKKFFDALYDQLGVSPEQILEQLSNVKFAYHYHALKDLDRDALDGATFLSEEDADPEVIGFIKNIVQRYTDKPNIKIILTDAIAGPTITYGSDLYGHYILCNIHLYNKKNIDTYYASIDGDRKILYDFLPDGSLRWIDLANLLTLKLIEVSAAVQHQTALFVFLITHASYQQQSLSEQTIKLGVQLHRFFNLATAVFQSVNPLESALFILKSPQDENNENLLQCLVKNLIQSYSQQSLNKFKWYIQKIKS